MLLVNADLPAMMEVTLRLPSRDPMLNILSAFVAALSSVFRTRAALQVEILALRHQIGVLQRSARKRQKLSAADRLFWAWLSSVWREWRSALVIVKPETVIGWHRQGFKLFSLSMNFPRFLWKFLTNGC